MRVSTDWRQTTRREREAHRCGGRQQRRDNAVLHHLRVAFVSTCSFPL